MEEVMGKTFGEYLATSERSRDPRVQGHREVFDRAYPLAVQLHQLRKRRGLTQKELAERSGVDQADISRVERGVVGPTSRTLLRLAEALDAEVQIVERASA